MWLPKGQRIQACRTQGTTCLTLVSGRISGLHGEAGCRDLQALMTWSLELQAKALIFSSVRLYGGLSGIVWMGHICMAS